MTLLQGRGKLLFHQIHSSCTFGILLKDEVPDKHNNNNHKFDVTNGLTTKHLKLSNLLVVLFQEVL